MKLNWIDCQNIFESLNFYLKNGQMSDVQKRELTRLVEAFEPFRIIPLGETISPKFENQVQQDLIDSANNVREAREKLAEAVRIKRNVFFVVFYQFTTIIKCALIILLASAGVYTLIEIVPKAWAVWAPVLLVAFGLIWNFIDKYVHNQG